MNQMDQERVDAIMKVISPQREGSPFRDAFSPKPKAGRFLPPCPCTVWLVRAA